ncbi:MAG: hypothetical protein H7Z15_13200, partial [Rhizobacter sp.]|nr:hypothetical protein [Rhizobacter sp.]
WQQRLRDGAGSFHQVVHQVLAACPAGETLSPPLSAALADAIRQRVEARSLADDYALRSLLPELCCALHADSLNTLSPLTRHPDETPSYAEALHAVTQVIAVRQALRSLTPSLTTSRTP